MLFTMKILLALSVISALALATSPPRRSRVLYQVKDVNEHVAFIEASKSGDLATVKRLAALYPYSAKNIEDAFRAVAQSSDSNVHPKRSILSVV